jgi:hypothetical protein
MRGFDTHETVQADAARFGEMTPDVARRMLAEKDASVATELAEMDSCGWSVTAEAPPGAVPAHLAVNHFLLDSWVHEYDLMLPRSESPTVEPLEAEAVVGYLVGLASVQTGCLTALDLRLSNPELRVAVEVSDGSANVSIGSRPNGAAVVEGSVPDLVDRATGRDSGPLRGDPRGLAVLDAFAELLAR